MKLRKIQKDIKGITLLALVVTIIVLLILAGLAINLGLGDNGILKRTQGTASTWINAETNEQLSMEEVVGEIYGITGTIDGVPIPDGFYYAGGSKDTGLVISDNIADKKTFKESTKNDVVSNTLIGNQFVWVPVANLSALFIEKTATLNSVTEEKVTTNIYSNLTIRSADQPNFKAGIPGDIGLAREVDVLNSYDTDEEYYKTTLGFKSTKEMAENFVAEYKAMSDSIKKYNGFYIGRYELTGSVDTPKETSGESLISQNWYNLYKACKNVIKDTSGNVKSTMIYGVQWDAVCSWLEQGGFDTDTNSSSWGNYKPDSGSASKISTGSNLKYEAKGIFDLAGNCREWTQEANSNDCRVVRGGYCNFSGSSAPASSRDSIYPYNGGKFVSSRATLYIK